MCGDYWDLMPLLNTHMARVYVTPLVSGWRLAIGGWFGAGVEPGDGGNSHRKIAGYCRKLSREFGEAHAFTTQGRMDWYAWTLARDGKVFRSFVWACEVSVDRGQLTPPELRWREQEFEDDEDWQPFEDEVMQMAAEYSVNPETFGPKTRSVGSGFLAATAWERKNGVPQRPLVPG